MFGLLFLGAFFVILIIVGVIWLFITPVKKAVPTTPPPPPLSDTAFRAYCASLNGTEMHNLIISGGRSADRFLAITRILNEANSRKIPTIVLHSGFAPFSQFSQNTHYDPCVGTDSDEIAEILTDAAANALNIDSVIHSSIKFVADVLKAAHNDVTLSDIVKFPCDDVMGFLDECMENNLINDEQHSKFKQRYNNPVIKDNILRLAPLFSRLKTISQKNNSSQPLNLQQAVVSGQILFFDLLSDTNTVLKELVFSSINKLTEVGKFWVVTEGISFIGKENSKVDAVFTKNRNNISLIYSGEDVPGLTSQREETFKTFISGNPQFLLFAHASGDSALKWANYFGREYQSHITINKTTGTTTRGFFDSTDHEGTSVNADTREVYKYPHQCFMRISKYTNHNNQTVVWGLNEGEGYFIKDSKSVLQEGLSVVALQPVQPTINISSDAVHAS